MILKIISLHQIQVYVIISQKLESLTLKNLQWQNPIRSIKPPLIACAFSSFFFLFSPLLEVEGKVLIFFPAYKLYFEITVQSEFTETDISEIFTAI